MAEHDAVSGDLDNNPDSLVLDGECEPDELLDSLDIDFDTLAAVVDCEALCAALGDEVVA